MMGFIFITIVVALCVLPLMWPLLWKLIWSFRNLIIGFLIPVVVSAIQMFVFKFCSFGPTFFKNRAFAAAFVFWQTYVSLVASIMGSIVRFILGMVTLLLMLPTVVGANTPETINRVVLLDSGHRAYLSAVLTHHVLNAPIFAVAANRLLTIRKVREDALTDGKKWPKSKYLVILMLIRFPHLKYWRKSAIKARQEEEEAKKKTAEEKKAAKEETEEKAAKAEKASPSKEAEDEDKKIIVASGNTE
eukprot:TRINITY_DN58294_c0_g1_i1.p1 TRINITY_DN58294_c0_g1~~TRINITY_DN58294_c0_g1_i1.p1  ORF type:complete len:267 (+),score=55.29 TRINITY_DN58294_c0_g1_i1:66-803(+)